MMKQDIKICTSPDGAKIAYATVGNGPALVKAANWISHLEYDWNSPVWRHWLERFSEHHTLVRYDKRGCGLSDRDVNDFSLNAQVTDLETVVAELNLKKFPLLGLSGGGVVALVYAARHPEKVSHLILCGSYVKGRLKRGESQEQLEEVQMMLKVMKLGWGKANPAFRQVYTSLFIPEGTEQQIHWFNELQRISTSPEKAVQMATASYSFDVTELAKQITIPTLILHARKDAVVAFEQSRQLASLIPNSLFVPLESKNHILLETEPAWQRFLSEVYEFIGVKIDLENDSYDNSKKKKTKSFGEIFEGQNITHYKILKKLGEGGMGVVYKAEDIKLHRSVALKFLPTSLTSNKQAKERFIKEARAASGLDHPNICTIHEIDETEEGRMFISMGYYEGMTLNNIIAKGQIEIDEVIEIAIQSTSGLAKAHQRGIIHRDIKPANLVVTNDGQVKILDFGIAKLIGESKSTQENLQIGTIAHISPEQLKGENFDHRSDIWSLGVVIYEMLTGKLPFVGEYDQAIFYSILNEEPTPIKNQRSEVPKALEDIVMKAISKNPADRYQYIEDMQKELITCMESQRYSGKSSSESENSKRHRKLSAIMFTDMVGYSAMAQKNESLAIELLEKHRQLLRPLFQKHSGNEIETIGDAFFVEFNSAFEAVSCAVEIQNTLQERNLKTDPGKQIIIRIGLHVGDVVHIGKYVHGDGVNIAARLEPLSKPGGICLSEDVVRQIKNKIDLPVRNMGPQKLKNIESIVDVYCIEFPWESKSLKKPKLPFDRILQKRNVITFSLILIAVIAVIFILKNFQLSSITEFNNRIAVLPLVNISQNSEDDYFADGMTEELISQLAKIGGLNVIARTSVLKYKNTNMNINEIGRELDVGTILEGSVRKASNVARVTVQLIDVDTQEHLWAEEYDRELKDIFKMQSDIALRIATELKIQLGATEKQQIEKNGTSSAEAYRLYLLGKQKLNERTGESIQNGLSYFQDAIELDPEFALAYVGIADCYTLIAGAEFGSLPLEKAIGLAKDAINNALQLDNTLAEAYNALAYLEFRLEWDWKAAENNFKKAIELKPGYASAYERYALYLALLGRYDEALPLMLRANELDPLSASVSTGIGRIYHFSGQYNKAIEQYKKTLKMYPDYAEALFALGLSYSYSKRYELAIPTLQKALELSNGRLVIQVALARAYTGSGNNEEALKIRENLIQQQQNRHISPYYFAMMDAAMGNKDAALDSLYKSYKEHFGILVYLKASPFFNDLQSEPRFIELLRMIGLED